MPHKQTTHEKQKKNKNGLRCVKRTKQLAAHNTQCAHTYNNKERWPNRTRANLCSAYIKHELQFILIIRWPIMYDSYRTVYEYYKRFFVVFARCSFLFLQTILFSPYIRQCVKVCVCLDARVCSMHVSVDSRCRRTHTSRCSIRQTFRTSARSHE